MKNKVEKISVYPVLADALMLPYYVSSIGIDDQFCFERPNGYYHTQIYIFTEGKGEISAKGKSYSVMPYYACYLPKTLLTNIIIQAKNLNHGGLVSADMMLKDCLKYLK